MYTKSGNYGNSRFSRPYFKRGGSSRFGSHGGHGGQHRQPKRPQRGEYINFSRFINKAVVSGDKAEHFIPEHNFADFKIEKELKEAIIFKGYKLPTPIQDQSIPHILKGEDIVGIANTGTGKTAAFLIPLINKVRLTPKEQVIILVPTRELAIQINQELKGFVHGIKTGMKIFSVVCVGGVSIGRQISELRYKNSFIIGTPGRVKDLIDRGMIRLPEFSTIVLDEADRMLDMGFINDMRFVMDRMPKVRHTLFFSATLSPTIEKLIHEFLKTPVRVSVKTRDTAKNVEQDIVKVGHGIEKIEVLHDLLNKKEFNKVLIFGRTKHGVEKLSKTLIERGFKAESIHGDKNHARRQRSLASFKENKVQVLVATDVAARGLDIPDVSHVINYDIPATYDDYVHRIGRTGRVDKKGIALTFIG
ncbi:MAG: DEAD/DEAH box helicase [Patescibacteria group bacterium]